MRYYLILLVASLLVGCLWPTTTPPGDEEYEDISGPYGPIRCQIGRGEGFGATSTEAFKMAKLIAQAGAVGININYTRIYEDGVYYERIRSRIRGTCHKYKVLDKETLPDGSKRIFVKVWVVPWSARPLFPNLNP